MIRLLVAALALCAPLVASAAEPNPAGVEAHAFESYLGRFTDWTYAQLEATLDPPAAVTKLPFDARKAAHFEDVAKVMRLSPEERAMLTRQGLVSKDLGQRFSMASMYQYIYQKDLPVLITSDSILHALHVSYDSVLMELEAQAFVPMMRQILMQTRDAVVAEAKTAKGPLLDSLRDADLYLTVAMNLLRGRGAPDGGGSAVVSGLGLDTAVDAILERVAGLKMETRPETEIYGGKRAIDWSQFKPRGHYTKSRDLQWYFRGMMWLGRADTGFNLLSNPPGNATNPDRERRTAAILAWAMRKGGGLDGLQQIDEVIGFMVGKSDNLTVDDYLGLLDQSGAKSPAALAKADSALVEQLKATGLAAQRIRSQFIVSMPDDPEVVPPAPVFQLFGQRFLLDSFVLANVVYDRIVYKGAKQRRMMPKGLDVMAALGNDAATRLLQDELTRFNYAAQLAAARTLVAAYPAQAWEQNIYTRWLDVLRALHVRPEGKLPAAMQTRAWDHKQLRAQLGSWAQLRHDTILYGKQSYTAMVGCVYPAGFVEPYPAFYAKLADLGEDAARLLKGAKLGARGYDEIALLTQRQARYFEQMAQLMRRLEGLAKKELAGKPFSDADTQWLKKTINIRGGGSGPPEYTGWYATLFYGAAPDKYEPTIADVHTDPNSQSVMEVGVGDTWPVIMVIDNDGDLQTFVGPSFSYYEFLSPNGKRLNDAEWALQIREGKLPPLPAWTHDFVVAPKP